MVFPGTSWLYSIVSVHNLLDPQFFCVLYFTILEWGPTNSSHTIYRQIVLKTKMEPQECGVETGFREIWRCTGKFPLIIIATNRKGTLTLNIAPCFIPPSSQVTRRACARTCSRAPAVPRPPWSSSPARSTFRRCERHFERFWWWINHEKQYLMVISPSKDDYLYIYTYRDRYVVIQQDGQKYSNPATRSMLNPPANLNVSAGVLANVMLGV